jgi:magnesium-transporting ATPase (P-type)
MKVAKISIVGTIFLSVPFAIPDLIYGYIDNDYKLCTVGEIYWAYVSYFLVPVMFAIIPLILLSVFGYKTYRNLQTPVYPTRPAASHIHRRLIDRELAQMVIVQILCFLFQTVTFFIINLYITITLHWKKNDVQLAMQNLFTAIAFTIYNTCLCVNFYIYFLKSPTFRAGVKKILMIKRVRNDMAMIQIRQLQ